MDNFYIFALKIKLLNVENKQLKLEWYEKIFFIDIMPDAFVPIGANL